MRVPARPKCVRRLCINSAEQNEQYCKVCLGHDMREHPVPTSDDPLRGATPITENPRMLLHQAVCWLCGRDWWLMIPGHHFTLLLKAAPRCGGCGGPVGIEPVRTLTSAATIIEGMLIPDH